MRISDWSSDVCSSDLRSSSRGNGRGRVPTTPSRADRRSRRSAAANRAQPEPARTPVSRKRQGASGQGHGWRHGSPDSPLVQLRGLIRSEEHTSELQSLMRISYADFCLRKKKNDKITKHHMRLQKTSIK